MKKFEQMNSHLIHLIPPQRTDGFEATGGAPPMSSLILAKGIPGPDGTN
jgi:hypothetical protein